MNNFLASLSNFYQKNSATLKAITTCLSLLGATNYLPKNWWESPVLSWSISSQTTLTIVIVMLSSNLYIYLKNRELKSEIESLILRNTNANTSPEEHAELVKKQLVYAARFYSHLLGGNSNQATVDTIKHENQQTET